MQKNKFKREKLWFNRNENRLKLEYNCKYCDEFNRAKCPILNKICKSCRKRKHFAKIRKNTKHIKELQTKFLPGRMNHAVKQRIFLKYLFWRSLSQI